MTKFNQLDITKWLLRQGSQILDECEQTLEEMQQLDQKLKEVHAELFQLQRERNRCKCQQRPQSSKKTEPFIRPEKIVLSNGVDSLKQDLDLMSVLSGMEVQSYVEDDHCCITYTMQHQADLQVKHGLRIELKGGANQVSKSDLPLGFNLEAVMEDFDNIMIPECLGSIRKALVAYYSRLEQFDALKTMLNVEAQLFKTLDGSHMEISFVAQSVLDEDSEPVDIVLMLDYRVYDIKPKQLAFKEIDLPEGVADVLRDQCALFKRKPLQKAFKDVFIDGAGPYKMVEQVGTKPEAQPPRHKRPRLDRHQQNDDTFLPEDCSEHSDDADI